MKQEPVLQNLFMYLVREGFPLGVRDYEDALKALRKGYGMHRREDLLRLCQTLWARTEEERRFLDALFNQLVRPTEEEVRKIIEPEEDSSSSNDVEPPISDEPERTGLTQTSEENKAQSAGGEFGLPTNQTGIGLPRARVTLTEDEYFIFSPRLLVSLRRLTLVWRRFKSFKREGPKVELDLEATVEEKCRHGIIGEPVLIPERRNQARLVIIIDVSTSMIPWRDFNDVLIKSLYRGQLGEAAVYYFHNVPDEILYEKETLIKPKAVTDALKKHQNSTLLIISDCGAARGYKSRERVKETKKFLKEISRFWYPVVWLNPMPPKRWKNTTAEAVKQLMNGKMYELSEEGLIKAIDVLRGKQVN